jgi:hypothetical protein
MSPAVDTDRRHPNRVAPPIEGAGEAIFEKARVRDRALTK